MVAIGIDLGTTYSAVAAMRNGKVELIANENGNRTTPSYVAFNSQERLIGDAAKNQAALNAENTIFDAKRLIGKRFNDTQVQGDMRHWPFKVTSGDGNKCVIHAEFKEEQKLTKCCTLGKKGKLCLCNRTIYQIRPYVFEILRALQPFFEIIAVAYMSNFEIE